MKLKPNVKSRDQKDILTCNKHMTWLSGNPSLLDTPIAGLITSSGIFPPSAHLQCMVEGKFPTPRETEPI